MVKVGLLFVASLTLILGCNESADLNKGGNKTGNGDQAAEEENNSGLTDDQEEREVDEPVMISGSFLTMGCGWDEDTITQSGRTAACGVLNYDDNVKFDYENRGWQAEWELRDRSGEKVSTDFKPLPLASRYHVRLSVPDGVVDEKGWEVALRLTSPDGKNYNLRKKGDNLERPWVELPYDPDRPASLSLSGLWEVIEGGVLAGDLGANLLFPYIDSANQDVCDSNGGALAIPPPKLLSEYSSAKARQSGSVLDPPPLVTKIEVFSGEEFVVSQEDDNLCIDEISNFETVGNFIWSSRFGYLKGRGCYLLVVKNYSERINKVGIVSFPSFNEADRERIHRITNKLRCVR